ncbi:pyridoxal-phosphate dependent enzyme [Brevibacterium picturae]|uniref:Cysteine synthase family protein n=1 Tax=Brevibacterium picturae TaxID=260553 RepID=A0ABP4LVJ6_9MICO
MKITHNRIDHNSGIDLVRVDEDLFALVFTLMKLTPAEYIIAKALRAHRINNDTRVVETTSGTLGLGLAIVCSQHGLPLTLVSDSAIRGPLLERIRDLGATVEIVSPANGEGIQQTRLRRVKELLEQGNCFWPQQYDNPMNAEAYHSIGNDLASHLPGVDTIVGPVGSGGSLCGITAALRNRGLKGSGVRAIAVDTPGSTLFGLPDQPRSLRGLGNSIHPKNLQTNLVDSVYWVTYPDAANATRHLHSRSGIYAGPTSGASYLAAVRDREMRPKGSGPTVFVCPDRGDRYPEVYSDEYSEVHSLPTAPDSPEGEPVHSTCHRPWNRQELTTYA